MDRSKRPIKLHLAVNLDQLKKIGSLPSVDPKTLKAKTALATVEKLLLQAKEHEGNGDEENAYVMYLRYLELIGILRKTKEYTKDSAFYDTLLGKKNPVLAFKALEVLDSSLKKRYKNMEEENEAKKRLEQMEMLNAVMPRSKAAIKQEKINGIPSGEEFKDIRTNGFSEPKKDSDTVISPLSLHSLMLQQSTSFLILDVRPSGDFQQSHIKHPNCYSVPEEIIKPGRAATILKRYLPENTKQVWERRRTADRIILVDWDSLGDSPSPSIRDLTDTLVKWDSDFNSRSKLQVLHMGYDDWLLRFPFITTNPKVKKPEKAANLSTSFSQMIAEVADICYPDLDESSSSTEQLEFPRRPEINRTAKPNAITQTVLSDRDKSIPSHVKAEQFKARFLDPFEKMISASPDLPFPETAKDAKTRPMVDRSTKAKVLMRGQNRTDLLQAQDLLLDDNLEVEKKRFVMEKQWELLRLRRESEIEREIKAELQKKEEELMEKLEVLDKERNQKDEENKRLRLQVESLKNRLRDLKPVVSNTISSKLNETEQELENVIREKEKEEVQLKREVERLRAERKKKEADEQKNRKNSIEEELGLDRGRDVPSDTATTNEARPQKIEPVESRVRPVSDFPIYDRTSKPVVPAVSSRARSYVTQGSGTTGLKNLGNTCYMNSVVQCLTHLEDLKDYFLNEGYKASQNANSTTKGEIAEEFGSVFERLWSNLTQSFACTDFKRTVGRFRPDWAGRDQQDADDFLVFILDCLHEDLNKVKKKQPLKEQSNDGKSDSEASRSALDDWRTSNQSKISELCYGQEKSALTCGTCGHSSVRFDMICTLVVPIPPSVRQCELDDCLSLYTKGESIPDWNCPKCKQTREAIKKLDLYRTPRILIITLKRFLREGYDYWKKRQTTVDYPLNNLRVNGSTYRLVAVINHYGTLDGGHYTASAQHPDSKEWYKFDDSDVHQISPSEAVTSAAYILFYSKTG